MTEEVTEEVTETPEEKPKGYDPVDLDKTGLTEEEKEAVQDRLNYLYKQVKTNQGFIEEFRDHNTKLAEKLEKQSDRLSSLESADGERSINSIKAELAEAAEIGDTDRVAELTDQLIEVKVESKQPREPEAEKPNADAPTMSIQDQQAVSRWAGEVTDDGHLARPWLNPAHPDSPKAQATANEIVNDPDWAGKSLPEQLAEVDRRMSSKTAATPPVMSSRGRPQKKSKPTLTEEEKHIARRMGVTEEKYLKQKEFLSA